MITSQTAAFAVVAFLLTITPGPDTMLVLRSALARGRRAGLMTTLGAVSGLFVHATLSALGLSLILVRSARAFSVVKWAGALYLVYLGLVSLRQAIRKESDGPGSHVPRLRDDARRTWRSFTEGMLNNVLNPKVAVFYLAFLPQFVVPARGYVLGQSLLLATIHGAMGIAWLSGVALLTTKLGAVVRHSRVQRGLEGLAGIVLLGFGLRLATERR